MIRSERSSQNEDQIVPNRLISLYFHSPLGVTTSTDPFKGLGLTPADSDCDLQRKIAWLCSKIDIESLLFRQYLCDVSIKYQFY